MLAKKPDERQTPILPGARGQEPEVAEQEGRPPVFGAPARGAGVLSEPLPSWAARYGAAALAVALALALRALLDPFLQEGSAFFLLSAAVLVAAAYGGLGPGMFATLLGALAGDYLFLPPVGTLVPPDAAHGLTTGLFVAQGLGISALGAWLASARRRARESASRAAADRESLRESEEALGGIREAERSRLARDLHDGPLQDLAHGAAEVHLAGTDVAEEAGTSSALGRAAAALGRASGALRRVALGLRAAVNDLRLEGEAERPFPELVGILAEEARSMDPACDVRLEVEGGFPQGLPGEVGVGLSRIAREALTNARRHSGARNVRVRLGTEGDHLFVEVADDGRGFGPGTEPGVGSSSMRERARLLGGALEVESAPGKGTTVRALVPKPPPSGGRFGGETTGDEEG